MRDVPHPRPLFPLRRLILLSLLLALLLPVTAAADWQPVGPRGGSVVQLALGAGGATYAVATPGVLFRAGPLGEIWNLVGPLPATAPPARVLPDPLSPDVLYTVTATRVFRSEDGGESWRTRSAATAGPEAPVVAAALVERGRTVLLRLHLSPAAVLLERSTDGGSTWSATGWGLPPGGLSGLEVAFGQPAPVYVAGRVGLYRSHGGHLFSRTAASPPGTGVLAVATGPADPHRVYALRSDGAVTVSRDDGRRWSTAGQLPAIPGAGAEEVELEVDRHDPERLYGRRADRVWISDDAGATWWQRTPGGEQAARVHCLLALPAGPGRVLAGIAAFGAPVPTTPDGPVAAGGVWASRDGGALWTAVRLAPRASRVTDLAFAPWRGYGLLAAVEERVVRRTGERWTLDEGSVGAAEPTRLRFMSDIPQSSGLLAAADAGALYMHWLGSPRWSAEVLHCLEPQQFAPGRSPLWGYVAVRPHDGCDPASHCRLLRWDRDGAHCLQQYPGGDADALATDPRDVRRLWVASGGALWLGEDRGAAWRRLPAPARDLRVLTAGPLVRGRLYAGGHRVWRSDDGGATWRALAPLPARGRVERIVADPVDPLRLYVVADGRLHATDDGGESWRRLDAGLPDLPVTTFALSPFDPAELFVALAGAGVWTTRRAYPPAPCVEDEATLCLGEGGRFRVQVAWSLRSSDARGRGRGRGLVRDAGAFGLSNPARLDLLVKVLDGRAVNGHFWLFLGALTNIPFTAQVTDTTDGASVAVHDPGFGFDTTRSVRDLRAFPRAESPPPAGGPHARVERGRGDPEPPCTPSATTLCLGPAGRFRATAEFTAPSGERRPARVATSDAHGGVFWFFRPDNPELGVKLVDGRDQNGAWWVYFGSLTHLDCRLTVTDSVTGRHFAVAHPFGATGGRGDIAALPELAGGGD